MALVPKIPTIPKKEDKLTPAVKPHQIKRCVCCGTEYSRATDFYNAPNTMLYRNNSGRLPVCRGCIDALFDRYQEMFDADTAIRRICRWNARCKTEKKAPLCRWYLHSGAFHC